MRTAATLGACVALAFVAYGGSLSGAFVFDDIPLLVSNDCHRGLERVPAMFDFEAGGLCTARPVRSATYALDYSLWGPGPWGHHLTNVLLHGVVGFLALLLFSRLGLGLAAWAGALLFLWHPAGTEAVANIAGRRDLLVALFGLLAVHGWLSRRPLLGLLALSAGLLSHESAAAIPLVVGALAWVRPEERRWRWLAAWVGWVGVFTLWTVAAHNTSQRAELWGGSLGAHIGTVLHGHLHYLGQVALPLWLQADYSPAGFPVASGLVELAPLVSLLVVGGLLALAVALRRRAPLASWAALAWFALLLPQSQIFPHHELLAEHRLYAPLLAFCGLLGAGLSRVHRFAPALLAAVYLALTWARIPDWRSEEALWTATLEVAPGVARAHANLGAIRGEQGRLPEAMAHFDAALRVRPDLCDVHFNRALVLRSLGRAADAADAAAAAWRCDEKPRWRRPVGALLLQTCRLEEAARLLPADDPGLAAARSTCPPPR